MSQRKQLCGILKQEIWLTRLDEVTLHKLLELSMEKWNAMEEKELDINKHGWQLTDEFENALD